MENKLDVPVKTQAVRTESLPMLSKRVDALNRRAMKLGCNPVAVSIGEPYLADWQSESGKVFKVQVSDVSISTPRVMLNGWSLAAVVDRSLDETVLVVVPGITTDLSAFQDIPSQCDHCETNRNRTETFLVLHEAGEIKQVGRNCLRDFLGHDPAALLWLATLTHEISDMFDECESFGTRTILVPVLDFLAACAAWITSDGWISRREAKESYIPKLSTSDLAWQDLTNSRAPHAKVSDLDTLRAAGALDWSRTLDPMDESDYLRSLGRIARAEAIPQKFAGILASAITAHARHLGKLAELAKVRTESNYIGTIGERLKWVSATKRKPATEGLTLTVTGLVDLESDFGPCTLIRFSDAQGNQLIWFRSGGAGAFQIGVSCRADATVKAHKERDGIKQTVLTRVSVLQDKEAIAC
jgi:hypothetical protein